MIAAFALAEATDGSMFIGDHKFIRKLKDGQITTIVTLPWCVYFSLVQPYVHYLCA